MKIALLADTSKSLHSTNWIYPWEEYCKEKKLNYKIINPYKLNVIQDLMDFDIILWHFSNYIFTDMLMARNILFTLESLSKKVFPSFHDSWHFDDKLAETYLLEGIKAPIPESFYFYNLKTLEEALKNNLFQFPIIAKLRNGSGSHNVKLIQTPKELISYGKTMFTKGFNSAPSLLYKTSSNIKSTKNLKTFFNRAKRIPEFLRSMANAKKFNREKGYVYLQEYIENNGFDLKVVVVGNKLSFIGRNIRKNDFRASGGGSLFYDEKIITQNIIDSAFLISKKLNFQCMGYDYVIDKNTGQGKIVEISYGFSHSALLKANGYFDEKGNWFSTPLNAPKEILINLLKNQ